MIEQKTSDAGISRLEVYREKLIQQCEFAAKMACCVALIFPILTALGWIFDVPFFIQGHPALPAMQPNTAFGLFLGAVALAIIQTRVSSGLMTGLRTVAVPAIALILLLLGGLTLAEYAFGWQLGIDGMLTTSAPTLLQPYPGRPSPQTSFNFFLFGLLLLAHGRRPKFLVFRQAAIVIIVANSILAMSGYLFSTSQYFGFPSYNPAIGMAVHTAWSFVLLTLALLLSSPGDGVMTLIVSATRTGDMARKILVAGVIAPPLIALLARAGVAVGLYDTSMQVSLFAVVMVGLVAATTWYTALWAEKEELVAQLALQRFDLAARGANLAIWDWNVITGEVVVNSRWAEMRGFSPSEVEPRFDSWLASIHTDDQPRVKEVLQRHLSGEAEEYVAEFRVKTKSGRWIWVVSRGKATDRDQDNQPRRMLGTELDITDSKMLQEQLRQSEEKFSGIVSLSADAIISMDEDQRIILFNEGAAKIFGYEKNEALGHHIDMLIPERFRTVHHQHVAQFAMKQEVSQRSGDLRRPFSGRRKNGEEFPIDASISKIMVDGKRIFSISARDISEQKRTESEQRFIAKVGTLLGSSLNYQDTLKHVAELVVDQLADFCIVDIAEENQQIRRLKVASRNLANNSLCDAITNLPLDRKKPHLAFLALDLREPFVVEHVTSEFLHAIAQSDEHLELIKAMAPKSILGVPLLMRGKLLGVITLISSTPTHIYTQRDLRLAQELANRASFAIENSRLYRLSELAVQTREDVLAVVSHDLKNPLSAIKLLAATLSDGSSNADVSTSNVRQNAGKIQILIDQSIRLVGDLIDFAKAESGTFNINKCAEDPLAVVNQSIVSSAIQARAKNQNFEVQVPPSLPRIDCDKHRIGQVIANLLGNAVKFTPEGGRIVLAAAVRKDEVVFSVADTGPGISPNNLRKVFDRFWQAPDTKKLGAGLGLSIAKGIVEKHGGQIWLESQLGKGSTFYFSVPVAVETVSSLPGSIIPAYSATGALAEHKERLSGVRVLIADDSTDILQLTKLLLESAGAEVFVASTVNDALAIFSEVKPDVLLTDIEMPDGGGLALIGKIHEMQRFQGGYTPVAAMTAYDRKQELERIEKAGFNRILSKPIDVRKVIAAIKEMAAEPKLLH